jgi:alcohol dehydrogenase class IV
VRTVHGRLRQAVREPDDLEARGEMLAAACSMGFALSVVPYGIIHALGHPLGAHFGVHHGVCVALFTPHGMRWNLEASTPQYAEASRAAGIAAPGASDGAAAEGLIEAGEQLLQELELPRRLGQVGATEDAVARMSEDAMADLGSRFNARLPQGPGEVAEIYQAAF